MTPNLDIKPDIKISVNQSFGIETDMQVDGFQKKMNMFLKLIKIISLIEIPLLLSYLALHLIKES